MKDLLPKLLKLKTPAKIGVTLGAMLVIAGIYYQLFYADLTTEIDTATVSQGKLNEERSSYEKRKGEYLAYRNELKQLQEEQREVLRVLPRKDELASFLSSVQEQAELSGLEVVTINVEGEIPEELFVKIPVRMEVRGGYHSVTKFFKNVSELKRIVNIEDLALNPDRGQVESSTAPAKLRAKFVAATYRYQDQNPGGGT